MRLAPGDLAPLSVRLRRLPLFYRQYGWWKVRLDPVYPLLLGALDDEARQIVDLGSGMGLFEALLLGRRQGATVLAVEHDPRKVLISRRLTEDLQGVQHLEADARSAGLGTPDAILLIDLLHYFTHEEQEELVARCASALVPGGVLLVRELDGSAERGATTRFIERLAVALGWNRAARVHPRPIEEMRAQLEVLGMTVSVRPAGRGAFSGNALLVAKRAP